MLRLIAPDIRFHTSFVEALEEFGESSRDGSGDYAFDFAGLDDPDRFEALVEALRADALPETPRDVAFVPCTYLWMTEDDRFVGFLAIRHELTDFLLNQGGHIGYSVRPGDRRRGHATSALHQSLPTAAGLGIDRVLVTCDEDNAGSRAVIEGNGGVYEDSRFGKRRYWIDAASA